ncbi:MAG: FAD-dependent monooxygenase [Pseudonocardiaceae bacterium]
MRVVVVGAGLGGLAAGIAVRRAGHEVMVLERAGELRETGAGIGVLPNGVLALEALGLGGPVRAMATPSDIIGGMRDRYGMSLLTVDLAAVAARCGAPVAVVRRTWLHRLLAAELPAGTVRTATAVRALHEHDGRVHLAVDTEIEPADAVVIADGAASTLRATLFPGHPGLVGSGEHAARAVAPVAPPGVELAPGEMLDHRTGDRFGCLPMAGGGVYWYSTWQVPAPAEPQARHRWLLARRGDWHPCAAALIGATAATDVHVVETAQLTRPLPTFAVGRVALLGDAAHAMTPDLGQGGCQAFEDAVALGTALSGTGPTDAAGALRRYDARRRPHTSTLQRQTRRTHRIMTLTGSRARARDATFRLVPRALATRTLARQFRFEPTDGPVRAAHARRGEPGAGDEQLAL